MAIALCLLAPVAFAEVIEDWGGVVPWFTFNFKKSKNTGRFMDSNGSKIDFGLGQTPEGKRAIKLDFNLKSGGFSDVWNFLRNNGVESSLYTLKISAKPFRPEPVPRDRIIPIRPGPPAP